MFKQFFKKKDKAKEEVVLDFSEINSNEKAVELHAKGVLDKLYLFPLDLGGQDIVQNIVYVPGGVVELKERYDNMVLDLLEQGLVSKYSASPSYKGESFIPSSIKIVASGEREFTQEINIW